MGAGVTTPDDGLWLSVECCFPLPQQSSVFPLEDHNVQTQIDLPKAFSIRDEHEFLPIQHLMARLNPKLVVTQVATGFHVNGKCTIFWGLVSLEGHPPTRQEVEVALNEAGFDFGHNVLTQASALWTG